MRSTLSHIWLVDMLDCHMSQLCTCGMGGAGDLNLYGHSNLGCCVVCGDYTPLQRVNAIQYVPNHDAVSFECIKGAPTCFLRYRSYERPL